MIFGREGSGMWSGSSGNDVLVGGFGFDRFGGDLGHDSMQAADSEIRSALDDIMDWTGVEGELDRQAPPAGHAWSDTAFDLAATNPHDALHERLAIDEAIAGEIERRDADSVADQLLSGQLPSPSARR
jgi:Ca2+-binding RTX toxin-like protein